MNIKNNFQYRYITFLKVWYEKSKYIWPMWYKTHVTAGSYSKITKIRIIRMNALFEENIRGWACLEWITLYKYTIRYDMYVSCSIIWRFIPKYTYYIGTYAYVTHNITYYIQFYYIYIEVYVQCFPVQRVGRSVYKIKSEVQWAGGGGVHVNPLKIWGEGVRVRACAFYGIPIVSAWGVRGWKNIRVAKKKKWKVKRHPHSRVCVCEWVWVVYTRSDAVIWYYILYINVG